MQHDPDQSANHEPRRNFLKSSLVTITTTFIGSSLINSFDSCKQKAAQQGEKVKVLTPDGNLV